MIRAAASFPRMALAEAGKREFVVVEPGQCYRMSMPGLMVSFEIDRLVRHGHELSGELMVSCNINGTDAVDGVLSLATFNVSSAQARAQRASQLERQSRASDFPWQALLEEFCQRVLRAERSAEPAAALRDVQLEADASPTIDAFGFRLPYRHPSIIFGDGGATKSLLALHLGGLIARDGGRVLLADWELDAVDHRERYATLFGTEMPAGLFYVRCNRPLVHEADRLSQIVRRQGIDYVIYDSVGFACHDAPETAVAALAYFQAVRRIGLGGLHLAHINKSEQGDQRPFGSSFWHNSARATWFLKRADDGPSLTVGVFNRKHNILKSLQPPFSYDVLVDGDRTRFQRSDITTVTEFAGKIPLRQRILAFLRDGAKTREQIIAEWPDEKAETVSRTLRRELGYGRLVEFPGSAGVDLIGLKAVGR